MRGSGAIRAMAPGWGSPREPQAAILKYISPHGGPKKRGEGERRNARGWGPDRPLNPPPSMAGSTGSKREEFWENAPLKWALPLPWAQKKGGGSTSLQAPRPNRTRPPSGRSPSFGVEGHGGPFVNSQSGTSTTPSGQADRSLPPPGVGSGGC